MSEIIFPNKSSENNRDNHQPFSPKKSLKIKSFSFARNWSLKSEKSMKNSFHGNKKQIQKENNFIPKLKSKQLLRQPKFFFALQRKKQKIQNSEPYFDEVKFLNPQMKGSRTKGFHNKLFSCQKERIKQDTTHSECNIPRQLSYDRKFSLLTSQAFNLDGVLPESRMRRNQSFGGYEQNRTQLKMYKRPYLYENMGHLIRKKKEIKSKMTLHKINHSKHQMTEVIRSFEGYFND